MVIGPMVCQGCRGRVWWSDARLVRRNGSRHSCKAIITGRMSIPRTRTPESIRAYNREWMARYRREQREHAEAGRPDAV